VFLEEEEEDHIAFSITNLKIFERSIGFERERGGGEERERETCFSSSLEREKDKNCEIFLSQNI
jgi:hypothetical protein